MDKASQETKEMAEKDRDSHQRIKDVSSGAKSVMKDDILTIALTSAQDLYSLQNTSIDAPEHPKVFAKIFDVSRNWVCETSNGIAKDLADGPPPSFTVALDACHPRGERGSARV